MFCIQIKRPKTVALNTVLNFWQMWEWNGFVANNRWKIKTFFILSFIFRNSPFNISPKMKRCQLSENNNRLFFFFFLLWSLTHHSSSLLQLTMENVTVLNCSGSVLTKLQRRQILKVLAAQTKKSFSSSLLISYSSEKF